LTFNDVTFVTKDQVLHELAVPHAIRYELPVQNVIVKLLAVGSTQLRDGFVYAHCKLLKGPRVSASLGILRSGIDWFENIPNVRLVLVVVGAADTPRSQADFISSFARIIYRRKDLLQLLIAARDSREAFGLLEEAERL
jgi:mannitol/fructose-specific phosphotransferase system IIA component (Ntr-type)